MVATFSSVKGSWPCPGTDKHPFLQIESTICAFIDTFFHLSYVSLFCLELGTGSSSSIRCAKTWGWQADLKLVESLADNYLMMFHYLSQSHCSRTME